MASTPASTTTSPSTSLATPSNPIEVVTGFDSDIEDLPPAKRYKPTPSFAKIKIPKTSPFRIYSAEEEQRATALDDTFVGIFEKNCIVRPRLPKRFEATFPVDIWKEILDHVCSDSLL